MTTASIAKWTSRLFVPVTLLVIAALLAVVASRPVPKSSESAAAVGAPAFESSDAVVDPESLPHTHTSAVDETSADGHTHDTATTDSADPTHQHTTSATSGSVASDGHTHDTTTPGTTAAGPIVSVDDPRLSPAQQDAARTLLVTSRSAIASLPNTAALSAAGYVPVGDNSSGMQHWVNDAYTHDGRELDASHIESFMTSNSTGRTTGAMYILEPGRTMANVPNIAGELTTWHVHQPICFSTTQSWHFVSFASNGNCPSGAAARNVPPMMHVWSDDPPCGPFVGTEGHGTTSCAAHTH